MALAKNTAKKHVAKKSFVTGMARKRPIKQITKKYVVPARQTPTKSRRQLIKKEQPTVALAKHTANRKHIAKKSSVTATKRITTKQFTRNGGKKEVVSAQRHKNREFSG